MNRETRRAVAQETLNLMRSGEYINSQGETVDFFVRQRDAERQTRLYTWEDEASLWAQVAERLAERGHAPCQLSVTAETTFGACRRLHGQGHSHIMALNFASAKNPGGGFLNGAQAQEEAVSRGSGLYLCQLKQEAYYTVNRNHGSALYTDHMIWSPEVPVFRDDADQLLDEVYTVSILTAPAVNAGAVRQHGRSREISQIDAVMRERVRKVLAISLLEGAENLVLGAWGCGVFRNDPEAIALYFRELLQPAGEFGRAFSQVVFAVPDFKGSEQNLAAFRKVFA